MRNFKRTLALVLAVIMVVGTFATVSAASTTAKWYDKAVEMLDNAGISNIGKGAAEPLSRNEFVMWIAKIESLQLSEDAWNDEIASVVFTDVTDAHHKAAIAYSYKANFIIGNGDGTFAPDKQLSLAEASAVIVRLMRYESKVTGLAEEWDMNYMRAAAIYCNAFDQTFYKQTGTFHPDYLLTKGETAYILATILNFVKDGSYNEIIKTADGIDLGARFEGMSAPAKETVYYIANLDRAVLGTNVASTYLSGSSAGSNLVAYKNEFDIASTVTLVSADQKNTLVISGSEFVKLVRVSLGLSERNDYMNEEAEINIFETVKVGTMVEFVVEPDVLASGVIASYKEMKNFKISSNSVVVDTVLQASAVTSKYAAYVGYAAAAVADKVNFIPTLPTSYDATMATSWTNITYDATTGAIASATLNFKGVAYEYGSDIVAYDANWAPMTVETAVNSILNTAQGEMYAVFNDVDADGLYDTIYVKESYAFAFTETPNIASVNSTPQNYMTSISNGKVVGKATPKYNSLGTVIWNREVGYSNPGNYSNGVHAQSSSDPYTLTEKATGKLQLVLCAANAHPVEYWSHAKADTLSFYTVVDLAAFYTGIIEEVDVHAVAGYYTAKVKTTDGAYVTVYIPVDPVETVELDVTIAGATATYTFNSSAWGTFMTTMKKDALDNGIAQPDNVIDGDSAAYLDYTAAWMAGKYVEFATDEENIVFCINGTESPTGKSGFVTNVEKTETGDNTYNVTIAVSGAETHVETVYIKQFTDATWRTESNNFASASNLTDGKHINKSCTLFTEGTNAAGQKIYYIADENGDPYTTTYNGEVYYSDKTGRLYPDYANKYVYNLVNGFETVEVRASASGMFDWANYHVYNQLFAGSLINPNTDEKAKVDAGKDLIYVTLYKDAGSNYVLYNNDNKLNTETDKARSYFWINSNSSQNYINRWYYYTFTLTTSAQNSWHDVEGEYIINLEKVPGSETVKNHANGVQYVEALYNATVGFEPYYYRTWNATTKAYEYVLGFTTVKTMTNVVGTADAIVDTESSLLHPVYKYVTGTNSIHLKLTTAEEIATYEKNGFFVDENGYVFTFIAGTQSIQYKKDKDGNIVYEAVEYDWAGVKPANEETDVLFTDYARLGLKEGEKVDAYATATITDKPKTAEGWFPGSYYLNIDGVNYNVTTATKVVLVTPSTNGFVTSTKTVGELVAAGKTNFFVTEWSGVVLNNNVVENIALVGTDNLAKTSTDDTTTTTPEDKTVLVYLDGSAKSIIRQNEYSKEWMVISDKSAYALPSGEEVGAIYRSYPTYAEALSAANLEINLGIKGGEWYIVDENNEIVSSTTVTPLRGQITEVKADGTTIANMNNDTEKNVVISNMNTEFFYFDAEGKVLFVADDNTNVSIIDQNAYNDLFKSYRTAVANADAALYGYVAVTSGGTHKIDISTGRIVPMETGDAAALGVYNYDEAKGAQYRYEQGNLSDERYAYYVENLETASAALVEAKAASLDKYFNGQFWGFANSPVYKYITVAQGTFQEGKPTLYFDYIVVDDTLCVFTDSFGFAG